MTTHSAGRLAPGQWKLAHARPVGRVGLATAVIVLMGTAHAQTVAGVVRGEIADPSGARVPGTTVILTRQETGAQRRAISDGRGEFTITAVAPGEYRLEAEHQGFVRYARTSIVEVDGEQDLRIELSLDAAGKVAVDVAGIAPLVRTGSPAMGGVIDNRQVLGLPLDGRDFYQLSLLLPGVAPAAEGSAGSVRGAFSISVNGAREDANNFLLDGVYNGDPKLNGAGVTPPVDAIREFEVASSTYDTSFGRNAGGQINVVTRSGGNQFHGTGYEFFSDGGLDGNNFFAASDQPAPLYRRNQFGGTLGGPLVRDRTFFFVDYQGTRTAAGQTLVANVPTLAERGGDFSQSGLIAADPTSGQPLPGNQVPQYYLNPIGVALAALYPLPDRNAPGANFVSSPSLTDGQNQFDARLDHSFRPSDSLFARYSFVDDNLFDPFAGSPGDASIPGYGIQVPSRAQNAALGETHIFSPALLNELRLAFNRVSNGDYQQGEGASVNRQLGLPEVSTNSRDWGLTLTSVNGFSSLGDDPTTPEHGTTNTWQIADNATWVRGKHLVKFGLDLRLLQQNAYRDIESRGFFDFTGLLLGNPLEELLLGAPTETGGAREDNPEHLRTRSYDFFANDTWRVRRDVTLTLGLRYEYNSPAVDAANRATVYDQGTGSLVQLGEAGFPRGGYHPQYRNFAPQIGLAWSPGGRNTTVLRAAYGIHYDQSALAPGEGLYFSAPYYNFNLYYPIQGLVNLSLSNPFPANFPVPYPGSAIAFQPNLQTPYVQQWNFSVQRQLGKPRVLEIAYVGSKGTHLIDSRNINQPQPSVNLENPGPNVDFSEIDIIESAANSTYHSFQARLQQSVWRGLSLLASYTYAKSIDDASGFFSTTGDPNVPQNSYDLRAERGRSDFDIRQRLAFSYAYDLPLLKRHRWIGGWQSFGALTLQTGQPLTVALLPDNDNSNTGISQLGFGANDRPNATGNPALASPTPREWFNTAAFATPLYGSFGNAGRNILNGPGLEAVNLSIVKNTAIGEGLNVQFRTEFFNALNHTNFNLPDNFLGSPTFGQVVSAQDPRRIQFALKFVF
ncbi:MAG: TonB-dependent receptor domain-containing protein [Bryobacteraceae bacterium]